ncbi:MAG: hypothetical protein JW768_05900 [Chitinispirillaceae bacterium]|nr:hypothetical protein [Chitinispirillaceae bacterium]
MKEIRITRRTLPAILLTVLSCATVKTPAPFILMDAYQSKNLSNRIVVLQMPDTANIIINNPKDVVDDYGGINAPPQSRIQKFYIPLFVETFKDYLSGDSMIVSERPWGGVAAGAENRKSVTVQLPHDSAHLSFFIPEKKAMQEMGLDSAVLVRIDRLTFTRNNFFVEYYWDDKTKRPANLEVKARVIIWDYKADAAVFYGVVARKIEFQIAMQRKHWEASARSLAKQIVLSAKCL